ncbi:MAG: hypothetical protein IT310_00015 [Anaerolineales bacterium]|nr:hypothetical protein [Anaerolineales bacterium]
MFPEITVLELGEKLKSADEFILLDVREPAELNYAKIEDRRLEVAPLSRLSSAGPSALPEAVRAQAAPIYILCHHGSRSSQVAAWLVQQGYKNVFNVAGGIDAYARKVDSKIGVY